jgi:hypothetical protein
MARMVHIRAVPKVEMDAKVNPRVTYVPANAYSIPPVMTLVNSAGLSGLTILGYRATMNINEPMVKIASCQIILLLKISFLSSVSEFRRLRNLLRVDKLIYM